MRVAGVCGVLAFVTFNAAWVLGGLAQPAAYSAAHDDISDLGAMSADSAWIYNQVGANLSGLLWRLGAVTLIAAGTSTFFDGIFRLDCRGIDPRCDNVSWHSHAHKIESRFTAAFTLFSPLILALAFRRKVTWRGTGCQPCGRSCTPRRERRVLGDR